MYDNGTKPEYSGKRPLAISTIHRVCDACLCTTDIDFIEFRYEGKTAVPVAVLECKGVGGEVTPFQHIALPVTAEMLGVPIYIIRAEKEVDDVADVILLVQRLDDVGVRRMDAAEFNAFLYSLRGKEMSHRLSGWKHLVERQRGVLWNNLKGKW